MKTRRSKHMLFGRIAAEHYGKHGRLPKSSMVALVAKVHPATARRWLADMREVMPLKASALTVRAQP